MGCPPHQPYLVGSSEMTVTVSQPCLEFTELGLAVWLLLLPARTSASGMSRNACVLSYPTGRMETPPEGVRSAGAAGAAWTLLSPPSLLSPGVWITPAHRL